MAAVSTGRRRLLFCGSPLHIVAMTKPYIIHTVSFREHKDFINQQQFNQFDIANRPTQPLTTQVMSQSSKASGKIWVWEYENKLNHCGKYNLEKNQIYSDKQQSILKKWIFLYQKHIPQLLVYYIAAIRGLKQAWFCYQ